MSSARLRYHYSLPVSKRLLNLIVIRRSSQITDTSLGLCDEPYDYRDYEESDRCNDSTIRQNCSGSNFVSNRSAALANVFSKQNWG
jgi:hypothetical protein